jgi:hypothetical protein
MFAPLLNGHWLDSHTVEPRTYRTRQDTAIRTEWIAQQAAHAFIFNIICHPWHSALGMTRATKETECTGMQNQGYLGPKYPLSTP